MDNIVSYVRKSDIDFKYLYHQQEALWNEIFIRYMGSEKMEKIVIENFSQGNIALSTDKKYKKYGWEKNKGYGTKFHRLAIRKHGINSYHRKSFTLIDI